MHRNNRLSIPLMNQLLSQLKASCACGNPDCVVLEMTSPFSYEGVCIDCYKSLAVIAEESKAESKDQAITWI